MATVRSLFSWRTLFILCALVNSKNLPFAWHIRLFFHFVRNMRRLPSVKRTITSTATTDSAIHPIFRSVSIWSRAPLLETDYNIHKSNSTYFTDLDISRTALVTNLLSAGFRNGNAELEAQGYKGRSNVILGSVHATYHKDVKPYELYEVRSRVLGWDQKWLIILSTFIRPGKEGKPETVLASALSKYVVKKARYTVPPERCLAAAGWFEGMDIPEEKQIKGKEPEKEKTKTKAVENDIRKPRSILRLPATTLNDMPPATSPSDSTVMINRPHEEELQAVDIAKLEAKAEEMSAKMDEKWVQGLKTPTPSIPADTARTAVQATDAANEDNPNRSLRRTTSGCQPWTWEMVEMERLRGLEIAKAWMQLDSALAEESARDHTALLR